MDYEDDAMTFDDIGALDIGRLLDTAEWVEVVLDTEEEE